MFLRALGVVLRLDAPDYGADFAVDMPVTPAYDPDNSASAPLTFPWVYACARVRSAAMSRLPLRVYRWDSVTETQQRRVYIGDHWLSGLYERPSSSTPGITFTQELQQDLDDDGNAYVVIVGVDADATPAQWQKAINAGKVSLHRVPPKRMEIIPARWGVKAFSFKDGYGQATEYDPRLVLHVRRGSFRDDPRERLYGTGAVRPLTDLLNVEQAQSTKDQQNASRGRPDVTISPKSDTERWNVDQRRDVRQAYEQLTEKGGALVLSGHVDINPLSFPPEVMATGIVRDANRSSVLAAYRTPPVMVGLETANYATAKEQKAVFWESIQDDASLHAWMWTELARRAGERDIYAELDTSSVHELSTWKSDALLRANTLWLMGMDLIEALSTQGLHEEAEVEQRRRDSRSAGRSKPTAEALRVLDGGWFQRLNERADAPPVDDEDAREERWRAIDKQLLALGEREMGLATREFLRDQGERMSANLGEQEARNYADGFKRDDIGRIIDAIFNDVIEGRKLDAATRQQVRAAIVRAFEQGQIDIGEDGVVYNADRIDQMVDDVLAELVVNVNSATKASLRDIVQTGLANGESVAEMQFRIQQAHSFSAARALTIARTETTRSTAAGTVQAYNEASAQLADSGIVVRKQWLSSRDGAVRDDHRALDGQTVDTDQPFVVPPGHTHTGEQGQGPAGFPSGGMSINCRCAVIPVIERTG